MADLKQIARQILHETLAAIDIPATMQRKLRRQGTRIVCGEKTLDLKDFEKIRVVAVGKAAHAMVEGLVFALAPFVGFAGAVAAPSLPRSEEHTSELQSRLHLVCRLLLEKKKKKRE